VDTTPFTFWPWLDDLVTQPSARIWISGTLIVTAAILVLLLRPRPAALASAPRA
jgi:hypothetical protein